MCFDEGGLSLILGSESEYSECGLILILILRCPECSEYSECAEYFERLNVPDRERARP